MYPIIEMDDCSVGCVFHCLEVKRVHVQCEWSTMDLNQRGWVVDSKFVLETSGYYQYLVLPIGFLLMAFEYVFIYEKSNTQ